MLVSGKKIKDSKKETCKLSDMQRKKNKRFINIFIIKSKLNITINEISNKDKLYLHCKKTA